MYPSIKMLTTRMKFWITDKSFEAWANNVNVFFILSIGRSGTTLLANLLNTASGAYVEHEPVAEDFMAYQKAFHSKESAARYVNSFRKKEIYLRCQNKEIHTYGEVNSAIRRHFLPLRQAFPKAKFIHLVRDGRDVVRSMISRKTMTKDDPNTKNIYPIDEDSCKDKWAYMSRFEKCCWYWTNENSYLRRNIGNLILFEKLISDYQYFSDKLLKILDIKISEDMWKKHVHILTNATKKHKLPHWSAWDRNKLNLFYEICSAEMDSYGYSLVKPM